MSFAYSLPQALGTLATPQFSRIGLGEAADANALLAMTGNTAANPVMLVDYTGSTGSVYVWRFRSNDANSLFVLEEDSNTNSNPFFAFRKGAGTIASPNTAITTGWSLGAMRFTGNDGASFVLSADIVVTTSGVIATGQVPSHMIFRTMTTGGVLGQALYLDEGQIAYTKTLQVGGTLGTSAAGLQFSGSGTTITVGGSFTVTTNLTVNDAGNIILGSTTGNQIGTAITQKMGFYGVTPIAQRAGAAQAAVATTGSTTTTPYGYTTAAQADGIVTLVNELRAWAVAQGFIKGAA